jgi:prepilin peptidase CpaA
VLFALRAIGGGDVKLLTALGLWIRPDRFAQLVVIMALLGGLLTVVVVAWHIALRQKQRLAIPYGVAIAAAGLWILTSDYLPGP